MREIRVKWLLILMLQFQGPILTVGSLTRPENSCRSLAPFFDKWRDLFIVLCITCFHNFLCIHTKRNAWRNSYIRLVKFDTNTTVSIEERNIKFKLLTSKHFRKEANLHVNVRELRIAKRIDDLSSKLKTSQKCQSSDS